MASEIFEIHLWVSYEQLKTYSNFLISWLKNDFFVLALSFPSIFIHIFQSVWSNWSKFFKGAWERRRRRRKSLEPKKTIAVVSPDFRRNYDIWKDTILSIYCLSLLPIELFCVCLLITLKLSGQYQNHIWQGRENVWDKKLPKVSSKLVAW